MDYQNILDTINFDEMYVSYSVINDGVIVVTKETTIKVPIHNPKSHIEEELIRLANMPVTKEAVDMLLTFGSTPLANMNIWKFVSNFNSPCVVSDNKFATFLIHSRTGLQVILDVPYVSLIRPEDKIHFDLWR